MVPYMIPKAHPYNSPAVLSAQCSVLSAQWVCIASDWLLPCQLHLLPGIDLKVPEGNDRHHLFQQRVYGVCHRAYGFAPQFPHTKQRFIDGGASALFPVTHVQPCHPGTEYMWWEEWYNTMTEGNTIQWEIKMHIIQKYSTYQSISPNQATWPY